MNTKGRTEQGRDRGGAAAQDAIISRAAPVLPRDQWLRTYTGRILKVWLGQRAPLGLAPAYATWITKDLSECYAQPLRRAVIEQTY